MSDNQISVAHGGGVETDDDRLEYTQGVRKRLVNELTADGMPKDKGDKMVLLAALDGIDRAALANKKIGSQERQGAADRQAAMIIASLANRSFATPSGSPFEAPIEAQAQRVNVDLNEDELPELNLVPGETAIGLETRNIDQFMSDVEAAAAK